MLSIVAGCSQAVLSLRQVDSILKYLDAAEHTVLSSGSDAAISDHNFAVFASRPVPTPSSEEPSSWQTPVPTEPQSCPAAETDDVSGFITHSIHTEAQRIGDTHDTDVAHFLESGDILGSDATLTAEMPPILGHVATPPSIGELDVVDVHLAVEDYWLGAGGSPSSNPRSGLDLDHFLMRHYAERVCHLFCVIDTVKSPWKTIHLPRALQSMGELSVTGKTTTVRSALCNALLSISAWYLSNDHHRHQNTELGQRWADVAAKYGYNAIAKLKNAVESDMYTSPKPKYKEFLASMLSMVTINVSQT